MENERSNQNIFEENLEEIINLHKFPNEICAQYVAVDPKTLIFDENSQKILFTSEEYFDKIFQNYFFLFLNVNNILYCP